MGLCARTGGPTSTVVQNDRKNAIDILFHASGSLHIYEPLKDEYTCVMVLCCSRNLSHRSFGRSSLLQLAAATHGPSNDECP
jgi:hypothetical protein